MYFPDGFPAEWIETETIDGEKCWNHYNVKSDDKNIDKICEVWHDYSMERLNHLINHQEDNNQFWYQARDQIKQLMEHEYAR
jgi:hypothetical protein